MLSITPGIPASKQLAALGLVPSPDEGYNGIILARVIASRNGTAPVTGPDSRISDATAQQLLNQHKLTPAQSQSAAAAAHLNRTQEAVNQAYTEGAAQFLTDPLKAPADALKQNGFIAWVTTNWKLALGIGAVLIVGLILIYGSVTGYASGMARR